MDGLGAEVTWVGGKRAVFCRSCFRTFPRTYPGVVEVQMAIRKHDGTKAHQRKAAIRSEYQASVAKYGA